MRESEFYLPEELRWLFKSDEERSQGSREIQQYEGGRCYGEDVEMAQNIKENYGMKSLLCDVAENSERVDAVGED